MIEINRDNLNESIKQIESIINKIKAIDAKNLRQSQRTLLEKRLVALNISLQLMNERLASIKEVKSVDIIQILGEDNLANARGFTPYKSIVFCVIDAIFSIRAKYNPTTINVLDRTAKALKLESRFEPYKVSDFLNLYENEQPLELANNLFGNKQRTSTSNGVLKSEAVMEALSLFHKFGIDTIDDFNDHTNRNQVESQWLKLKGQSTGVTWRYLCMLAGDQNKFKDDTHIYNFFINKLGYSLKPSHDYDTLEKLFHQEHKKVISKYPNISVAILDHMIWKYMSGNF